MSDMHLCIYVNDCRLFSLTGVSQTGVG